MKLLFVVHRYGMPGGSEYNVQRLAEEAVRRGIETWVYAEEHTGTLLNGVNVTHYETILNYDWDLIIVHGSCSTQDRVHRQKQRSPVYYMLIEPPKDGSVGAVYGAPFATWIGCGTEQDMKWVHRRGLSQKAQTFRYGVDSAARGAAGFKEKYGITTPFMYMSAGGFWPHKRFPELAEAFMEARIEHTTLVLMGYDTRHGMPRNYHGQPIVNVVDVPREDVYNALYEADLYVMNSEAEGYGLMLLEAMYNDTPWISRNIAAGHDLSQIGCGHAYETYPELVQLLKTPARWSDNEGEQEYVEEHFMIQHSLDSILGVLG